MTRVSLPLLISRESRCRSSGKVWRNLEAPSSEEGFKSSKAGTFVIGALYPYSSNDAKGIVNMQIVYVYSSFELIRVVLRSRKLIASLNFLKIMLKVI